MVSICGHVRGGEGSPLRACGVEHSMMRLEQGQEIQEVCDVPTWARGKASAARRPAFLASDPANRSPPPDEDRRRAASRCHDRGARRNPRDGAGLVEVASCGGRRAADVATLERAASASSEAEAFGAHHGAASAATRLHAIAYERV
jgi:hypothetical protein